MTADTIHSMDWQFKRLSSARAVLGESPVWHGQTSSLWWVDIDGKQVFRTSTVTGETDVWPAPEFAGCIAVTAEGTAVVGMESGLFRLDSKTGEFSRLIAAEGTGIRFNDSTVDDYGNLWAATMDVDNVEPIGTLYRISPDLTVSTVLSGLITPNGLAVDAKRERLYLSDSHPSVQTVWSCALDLPTGAIGEQKVFFPMHDFDGRPDGATLDAEGNYWIAGVGGALLYKLAPNGTILAKVETPMPAPTKIAFGGDDCRTVFLTSKSDDQTGSGGHLVAAETNQTGRTVPLFGYSARPLGN